jgi:hypothetical protein
MADHAGQFRAALHGLLRELLDGPPDAAFVLNRGDRGLLASLEALSAEGASAHPEGRASVAAHVDHLRYGLSLLNRWARGDDPWKDANYSESWTRLTVSSERWRGLRDALAAEARAWASAIDQRRDWDRDSMTEAMASVIHLAYHLGAIRQLAPAVSGPRAKD